MPAGDLVQYLERLGMAFGADTNASTSFDSTVYKLELPSNTPDLLDRSLLVLREKADKLLIPAAELDKERGVVLSEKRLRDTAQLSRLRSRAGFPAAGRARYAALADRPGRGDLDGAARAPAGLLSALLHALAHHRHRGRARSTPPRLHCAHPQALRQLPGATDPKGRTRSPGQRGAARPGNTPALRGGRSHHGLAGRGQAVRSGAGHARTSRARDQPVPGRRGDLAPPRHPRAEAGRRLPRRHCAERRLPRLRPDRLHPPGHAARSVAQGARASRRPSCGARSPTASPLPSWTSRRRTCSPSSRRPASGASTRESPGLADNLVRDLTENRVFTDPDQDLQEITEILAQVSPETSRARAARAVGRQRPAGVRVRSGAAGRRRSRDRRGLPGQSRAGGEPARGQRGRAVRLHRVRRAFADRRAARSATPCR